MCFVWAKGSLNVFDAAVLILIYVAYLFVLGKMPPQEAEGIEDLESIPRSIVTVPAAVRNLLIAGLFVGGGAADLRLGRAVRGQPAGGLGGARRAQLRLRPVGGPVRLGVPGEGLGLLLGPDHSPRAHGPDEHGLEQHQPVDAAGGHAAHRLLDQPGQRSAILFDDQQKLELLMTLGQSLVGMLFLVNMGWPGGKPASLFSLWFIQFAFSPVKPGPGFRWVHGRRTSTGSSPSPTSCGSRWGCFVICAGRRNPEAFRLFAACGGSTCGRPGHTAVK